MRLRIIQHRYYWYAFSFALIIPGVVFLLLGGLRFGTDFTGGSLLQVSFPTGTRPQAAAVQSALEPLQFGGSTIQAVGEEQLLLRTRALSAEEHTKIQSTLAEKFSGAKEEAYSFVGPTIGRELRNRAVWALVFVLLGIIVYISWAFRKSTGRLSGWAFGTNAIIALLHDVFIVIGAFAFLGYVAKIEIDVLFVTAVLTVLGFSVHDTIVVFDRIREGMRRSGNEPLEEIINRSINETLIRSVNTSVTALLVLFALFFFGGVSIHFFVLALIIGIIIGTYSSIFIASPLLLFWVRSR